MSERGVFVPKDIVDSQGSITVNQSYEGRGPILEGIRNYHRRQFTNSMQIVSEAKKVGLLEILSPLQQQVVSEVYIEGRDPATLTATAVKLNKRFSIVQRAHSVAISKLRRGLEGESIGGNLVESLIRELGGLDMARDVLRLAYQSNTLEEMAETYGLDRKRLTRLMEKQLGIEIVGRKKERIKIIENLGGRDQARDIISGLYHGQGKSAEEVGNALGEISPFVVYTLLNDLGIPKKSSQIKKRIDS